MNVSEQERNKAIVRDYFEICWNQKNLEYGRKIIAPDYDFHMPIPDDFPPGFEGWYYGVSKFFEAFPDQHWEIRQILADGDLVATRCVWTATHQGEFCGVAPSGKTVNVANTDFYRLRDGMLIEHWDVPDWLTILRQIGGRVEDAPDQYTGSVDG